MNIKNNKNCKITINDGEIAVSEKEKTADEKWITIKHNKNYEVSNQGNVRNKNTKRVLKPAISNKGYYLVALSHKGKSHTYTIHKLVMEHFNRCAFDREVINHIDCNKLNNNINNLEYVTQKENCIKAWENKLCEGIRKKATKRIHSKEIKTSKAVIQYDLNGSKIKEFVSIRDAERQTGIDNSNIIACCKLRKRIAGGYIWRYKQAINKKCKELRLDIIKINNLKESIEYFKKINNYGTDKEPYYLQYELSEAPISFEWYKAILNKIKKYKPKRVIDIGSNINLFGYLFANEGIEYIGIDIYKDVEPLQTNNIKFIHSDYYKIREQFKNDICISCLCVGYLIPIEDVICRRLIINSSEGTRENYKCTAKEIFNV